VDAPVVPAGLAPDGSLDLPANPAQVAWYAAGTTPAASGSAVLAGHVDFDGREGVFFALAGLPQGSRIEVSLADGRAAEFRTVGPAVRYAKSKLPVEELFRRGGEPQLVLVTCGGRFDPVRRSYDDNTVVRAVPVEG
jgi:hypothetical protein